MYRLTILGAIAMLAACGGETDDPGTACAQATQHFQECTGRPLPSPTCSERKAEEILSHSCAELRAGLESGKADWWFGRGEGEPCLFNIQCKGDLVCMPTSTSHSPQYCMKPGGPIGNNSSCDSDYDCADGYYCCYEEWFKNGTCDRPNPSC